MNKAVTSHGINKYEAVTKKVGSLSHDGPIKKEDPPSRRRNHPAGKEILLANSVTPREPIRARRTVGIPAHSSSSIISHSLTAQEEHNHVTEDRESRESGGTVAGYHSEFIGTPGRVSGQHIDDFKGTLGRRIRDFFISIRLSPCILFFPK